MPGAFTWTSSSGGGTVGTFSSDTNSLVPGNLMLPDWDSTVPSIAIKAYPLGGSDSGYTDTVYLNPLANGPSNGSKIADFATPPGVTRVQVTVPAKLPAGVASANLILNLLDLSNNPLTTPGAGGQFVLTSTLTNCTLTPQTLVGNTQYRLQVRTTNTGATQQNQIEAGLVQVTPTVGQTGLFAAGFERYHVRADDLWHNLYGEFYTAGAALSVARQSMGARVVCETTATSLSVEVYPRVGSSSGGALQQYVVLVNERLYTTLGPFDTAYNLQHLALTLPAGRKRLDILTGIAGGTGILPSATLYPCSVRALYWPTGQELRVLPPPRSVKNLAIYGDSIAGGQGATYPSYTGWVGLVRQLFQGSVAVEGRGGGCLFEDGGTAAARVTLAKRLAAARPSHLWLAIGTNDYGLSLSSQTTWNAAGFGAAYANVLDLLRQLAPQATIYAQTPIVRSTESVNAYNNTLGDYRAQITTAAGARPWVTLVDGAAIMTTGDLGDGLHPNPSGHEKYAVAALAQLATSGAVPGGFATTVATASTAWTQATIQAGDLIPIDIPCPGAAVGDTAEVSLDSLVTANADGSGNPITNSVQMVGETVSAAGTVSCALWNVTGTAVTVPAGTLRCVVTRTS
jgi:lysophospholipase L1-like esterase